MLKRIYCKCANYGGLMAGRYDCEIEGKYRLFKKKCMLIAELEDGHWRALQTLAGQGDSPRSNFFFIP